MADRFQKTLNAIAGKAGLAALNRGVEKESLRVDPNGSLARSPHPSGLGSALTHPFITTDFSEAQLELITGVHPSAQACLTELEEIHGFTYLNLGNELLWTTSMPCVLRNAEDIPVGRYGASNVGQSKTVYRLGLGNRYGRVMQTISGIHYNFSVPDSLWPAIARSRGETAGQQFSTTAYFDLIRNFRRFSWLLVYLFGASPAVCKSFVKDPESAGLEPFDEGSYHRPFATSLRLGRLGYQSDAQSSLHVSYNSLAEYAASLHDALTTPHAPYAAIGVKDANGEYLQLNTNLLQIENEFYGTIRPKRRTDPGERPIHALRGRGVEYVEVRCLDLNPFLRVGIDATTMRFIDTFLLYCLMTDSPPDSRAESAEMLANQLTVVDRGREPGLELMREAAPVAITAWAQEILDGCAAIADLIDAVAPPPELPDDNHEYAVGLQRRKLADPDLTPSAQVLETMRSLSVPFFRFAMNQSIQHKGYFREHRITKNRLDALTTIAAKSRDSQHAIELADAGEPFDAYLERYLKLD